MSVTIRSVRTICTAPAGSRLVIVRVDTSEPGLYGIGCATFTQRHLAVIAAIEHHLAPLVVGHDASRIEDLYHRMTVNGYWRNGPVLNNAISGIDMALWDIKGKMAGMPVYDLLGGACRSGAQVYTHANGASLEEVAASVAAFVDEGYRFVRVQHHGYGGATSAIDRPDSSPPGVYYDSRGYVRSALSAIERVRRDVGEKVELLHDVHERLYPSEVIQFARDLEPFRLYFLEDPFAPEDIDWFPRLRAQTSTPLAMGELFNNPNEWLRLVSDRLIDFVRMHVSQIGGITPARHLVSFAHQFGVRTAWHGPGDVSPVGHAANLHLDLWAPNFGVQEWCRFPEHVYEIFPGTPEVRGGYMYANDRPGLGIDIDEKLAARYGCPNDVIEWTQTRRSDGTPARP
jgi:mannonate dehydratase